VSSTCEQRAQIIPSSREWPNKTVSHAGNRGWSARIPFRAGLPHRDGSVSKVTLSSSRCPLPVPAGDLAVQGILNPSNSMVDFLRTESSSSVARKSFSMKKLKESIVASQRSGARRERARRQTQERGRYSQNGSPDIDEKDLNDSDYERSRREPGRRQYQLPRVSGAGDAPPHPSTLLEIPEDDLEKWLDEGLPPTQSGFRKSDVFDEEAALERSKRIENRIPVMLAGGFVVLAVIVGVAFLVVTKGGSETDIFTSKGSGSAPSVGEPGPALPLVPAYPIVTTPPPPRCIGCTRNITFEGCFFNASLVSFATPSPEAPPGKMRNVFVEKIAPIASRAGPC